MLILRPRFNPNRTTERRNERALYNAKIDKEHRICLISTYVIFGTLFISGAVLIYINSL